MKNKTMKYKKLFADLREYAISNPNTNLTQFKETACIIWNNMTPTEKDLFQKDFNRSIVMLTTQESLKETIKRINRKTKP